MAHCVFVAITANSVCLSPKIVFLVNSAYTDEMPRNAAFHLVLHCLSKYHDVHKGLAVDKLGCFCVLFL